MGTKGNKQTENKKVEKHQITKDELTTFCLLFHKQFRATDKKSTHQMWTAIANLEGNDYERALINSLISIGITVRKE